MKNKIISLALLLTLLLTVFSVSGFALDIEYTNETDGILMTPVSVTQGSGAVTVSMSAKKTEGSAENLMFVVSRYSQKKLVDVEIQTKSVGTTKTPFSVTLTGVSGEYEINAALVSPSDSFMPKGTPASFPAKEGAEELRDLVINGESVFEELNENNEYIVSLSKNQTDYGSTKIVPYTMDASSTVTLANGTGVFPDKQILTVKANNGKTTEYTILYEFDIHVVDGATSSKDFVLTGTEFTDESASKSTVATKFISGDGKVYANLHEFVGDTADYTSATDTGSRMYSNSVLDNWIVYKIHDEEIKGADYIPLESNFNSAKFADAAGVSELSDGDPILEFKVDADATISVITTVSVGALVSNDGFTCVKDNETVLTAAQPVVNQWSRNFNYRYAKDYYAGETVTIPYRAAMTEGRTPVIVVVPKAEASGGGTIDPIPTPDPTPTPDPEPTTLISELTNVVSGMSYQAYCTYAGETYDSNLDGELSTITNAFIQGDSFAVGSLVGPNTQRTVNSISSDYSYLEGLEYIRFNNSYTYSQSGSVNWLVEAYSGVKTTGPTGSGESKKYYGFSKIVPWSTFKVTKPAEVIIAATGESAFLEEKGWSKTVITGGFAFDTIRTNGEVDKYSVIYKKEFAAGDTVEIYNLLTGYQKQVYFARPLDAE